MRVFRHTLTQRLIAAGTDEVIGHAPIPSDCTLNNVWCETHVVATGGVDVKEVAMYGVDGRLIPDRDPGDAVDLTAQWDLQVQKDEDVGAGVFSIDPGSSETSPLFEPGEPNLAAIMDIALDEKVEFYKRRKLISFISTPRGFIDGTPDVYLPGDVFKFHAKRNMRAEVHSNAILSFSNPSLDDVTTTAANSFNTEAKWMQMKYFEVVLEQSWMELMGLTEAGSETPWEEAALLVEEVLEPTVIEETAGSFQDAAYNVFCSMTFDITVPGRRRFNSISAA